MKEINIPGLEEAADTISKREIPDYPAIGIRGTGDYEPAECYQDDRDIFIQGFIAGAKWMAGQGRCHDGVVTHCDYEDGYRDAYIKTALEEIRKSRLYMRDNFKDGDKVIVQIRKV